MKRKSFKHENEVRLLRPEVELISEREYDEWMSQGHIDEVDYQEWKQPIFVNMDGENGLCDAAVVVGVDRLLDTLGGDTTQPASRRGSGPNPARHPRYRAIKSSQRTTDDAGSNQSWFLTISGVESEHARRRWPKTAFIPHVARN